MIENNMTEESFTYPSIDMHATGINIKRLMKEKGVTAKMVKERLNLRCVQSVYKWQRGESFPTIENLIGLSKMFGVSMEDVLIEHSKSFSERMIEKNSTYEQGWKAAIEFIDNSRIC